MIAPPRVVRDVLTSDVLHLILMPTEACNFRCTYCYEDFRAGRMEPDVVRGVEALLSRRIPGLALLDLSWFGGEPLAAADIMVRILRHVRRESAGRDGFRFRSDVTTNGWYLDRPLFDTLVGLGVDRYQISFDGPRAAHDRKRVRRNGSGSWDRVWSRLREMKTSPAAFLVDLRLHVDRDNVGLCPEFLAEMARDFGGDPRFRLFPRLLSRWGGPNDAGLSVYGEEEGREALRKLEDRARELGLPLHPKAEEPSVCYAARSNAFLVRADGRINKCTLALSAPENQVGRLTREGRLELDRARFDPWLRGLWSGSAGELGCPKNGLVGSGSAPPAAS